MNTMKKVLALMLAAMVLLPIIALADSWYCGYCGTQNSWNYCQKCGNARQSSGGYSYTADVYATANQRIATRTGPGTQYSEMGTYYLAGQTLRLTYKAWDSRNGIYWVLVDIPGVGQLWTGAKRFDNLDLNLLPDWNSSSGSTGGSYTGSGSGSSNGGYSSGFGQSASGGSQYNWLVGKMGMICVNEGIVRTGAGTNYYEAGIAYYGEWYEILDVCRGNTTKDWCQINFNGTLAWISTGLLEIDGIQGGTIYGEWAP